LFSYDVIVQCVTWYLKFKLSYRDLAQMMGQLGTSVVLHHSPLGHPVFD